jgi:hypothetical protein
LSEQLSQSDSSPETQDLAKLAKAFGEAPDQDVQDFVDSGYLTEAESALSEPGDTNTALPPPILTNKKTNYAAIGLFAFGGIALVGGIKTFKLARVRSYAALSIGVASFVVATRLTENPNQSNKESAQKFLQSSGILAIILGLGATAVAWQLKGLPPAQVKKIWNEMIKSQEEPTELIQRFLVARHRRFGFENLADVFDSVLKRPTLDKPGFNRRMVWGAALAAIGAGLVATSTVAFKLADTPSPPAETLQKINNLIVQLKHTED